MTETVERVKILQRILDESRKVSTFPDKAALFAAAREVASDVREAIDEDVEGEPYMREKLLKFEYFLAAGLGFDVSAGPPTQCLDFADAQLHTLASVISDNTAIR